MIRDTRKRHPIPFWAVIFGLWVVPASVGGQENSGDPIFTFGIDQKVGATENIRLDSASVGTTYFSDTKLSFGLLRESGAHVLEFSVEGVGRIVDDPVVGTDSGIRDIRSDLRYVHEGANSRFSLNASYWKPDLAFLDPLTRETIDDQDFFRGGGTREDISTGVKLETGLYAPLGFVFDLNSFRRSYSNTTDPLLSSNQTDSAALGAIFRFAPATRGRIDYYESWYQAEDTNQTDRTTRRFTFGLDHDFSAIDTLSLDLGHSKVFETFDAVPGLENNLSGPVGTLIFNRVMPNGLINATLDTTLNQTGRQTRLEFGRIFDLPAGGFEISLGAAKGDTFGARPIGRIAYDTELARGAFNAELSRTASISDTLSQATETTRLNLGYSMDLTAVSALSLNLNYADISLVGNNTAGGGRERASFYASYSHDVTEDWDVVMGYEYKYFSPDVGPSANSNGIFFTLRRDFEAFR